MAHKYILDVEGVPKSPSPIANAVVAGNTCYISGQLSVYEEGYRAGTAKEEAKRAFDLVFLIAAKAHFTKDEITFVDIAFSDLGDLPEVNDLYKELFAHPPARTIYEAAALPFGAKIKVQAVAVRDSG